MIQYAVMQDARDAIYERRIMELSPPVTVRYSYLWRDADGNDRETPAEHMELDTRRGHTV